MKLTLRSMLGYLAGIPILLFGLLILYTTILGGVAIVIGGLVAIPKTRRLFQDQTGIELSTGAAGGIPAIMLMIGMVLLAMSSAGVTGSGVPGDDVSNVSVSHEDLEREAPDHELHVTYNTRAQDSVNPDPDDGSHYSSGSGQKYLVIRMELENRGSSDVELSQDLFRFETGGVVHDYQSLLGSGNSLQGTTLEPGSTYNSWVVFSIADDVEEGTLRATDEPLYDETATITFEKDSSMAIEMAE